MNNAKKTAALAAILLFTGGCTASGGAATLPEGETNLSCGALIYAASNLLGDDDASGKPEGFENSFAVLTKYAIAHGKEKGVGGNAPLDQMKVQAYRMTGAAPGGTKVSSSEIERRAKACMGS